jgi:hypothetical protein
VRADNLYVDVNFACFLTGGQLAPLRFTCALAPLAHTGAVLGCVMTNRRNIHVFYDILWRFVRLCSLHIKQS